jgi:hypothetical protein
VNILVVGDDMLAPMSDHRVHESAAHIDRLERLSSRIGTADPPSRLEVEQALEAGFGCLMGYEVQLQRVRGRSQDLDATEASHAELLGEAEMLRAALTQLRTLSSSPGPSRIGYGFVLPKRARDQFRGG